LINNYLFCGQQMSQSIAMSDVLEGKDQHMILEENRLKSFKDWPFKDGLCTKEKMSSSGFYHCNLDGDVDGVRCFCCFKELDGWDQTDDPWAEHKRNNNCFFANLSKPENKLTVKEFLKVIEEREINLVTKRMEINMISEKKLMDELGLSLIHEDCCTKL